VNVTTLPQAARRVEGRPACHPPRKHVPARDMFSEPAATAETLWQAYLVARARAEASRDLADGTAAGKAWGRFLSAFVAQ